MATEFIEPFIAILLGFIAGGLGGFMNSLLKWLEIDAPFSTKSNVKAIIMGVMAGVGLTIASISVIKQSLTPELLVVQLFIIFVGAAGVQSFTNKISGIVSGSHKSKGKAPITTDNNPNE